MQKLQCWQEDDRVYLQKVSFQNIHVLNALDITSVCLAALPWAVAQGLCSWTGPDAALDVGHH